MPAELHEYVMARSGGIPWIAVDTVRRLVEAGDLHLADGRWFLNHTAPEPKPTNMLQARRRQLDELPIDLADALRAAAVMGNTFWLEALQYVGVNDPEAVCSELVAREFFRECRTRGIRIRVHRIPFRSISEIVYDSILEPDELSRFTNAS